MAQWQVTTAPTSEPVTAQQVADHAKLDSLADEQTWVDDHIDIATDYAESETEKSLITRTITAIYSVEQAHVLPQAVPFAPYATLELFRGPVQSVTSVQDYYGNDAAYQVRHVGRQDFVILTNATIGPVTVVYTAGFGDAADDVPADIKGAILAHVAHMYRYREADDDSIPTGLRFIYEKYKAGGAG